MTSKATVGICGHAAGLQDPGLRGNSHCYNPLQGVVLAPPEQAQFYWSTQRAEAGPKNHLIWVRVSGTSAANSSQVNGEDLDLAKPACKTSKTKGLYVCSSPQVKDCFHLGSSDDSNMCKGF